MTNHKPLIPISEDFTFGLSAAEFENLKSHFATASAGWGGSRCRNILSMTSTRNDNVSLLYHFGDTFSGRIYYVDVINRFTSRGETSLDCLRGY